jgi:hypothetical protein
VKGKEEEGKQRATTVLRRRPLPEDFAMRGFPWVENYIPDSWFKARECAYDDDEKYFETLYMMQERRKRIIHLGYDIAKKGGGKWLTFDKKAKSFDRVHEVELELPGQTPAMSEEGLYEFSI